MENPRAHILDEQLALLWRQDFPACAGRRPDTIGLLVLRKKFRHHKIYAFLQYSTESKTIFLICCPYFTNLCEKVFRNYDLRHSFQKYFLWLLQD
jgi:hypothetical protein